MRGRWRRAAPPFKPRGGRVRTRAVLRWTCWRPLICRKKAAGRGRHHRPHGHDRTYPRSTPRLRRRPGHQVRRVRAPLHVVPDRRPLPRRVRRRAVRRRARRAQRDPQRPAAVAVRAHSVLQHALLLLRVQQGADEGPRPLGQVHPLRRARDRHGRRARRGRAAGRAAALGRRHADVPVARRDGHADARAARELLVRRRRRDLDRGRPAQGQRRDDRVPGRAGLQPHLRRHPGLRPRSAGGGEPHPVRGRDAHGDGRGAPLRLRVGQRGPDLRPAAADGGGLLDRPSTA